MGRIEAKKEKKGKKGKRGAGGLAEERQSETSARGD